MMLKKIVRRLLPEPLRARLSSVRLRAKSVQVLGLRGSGDYARARHAEGGNSTIRLPGGHQITLRNNQTDLRIFEQIFLLGDCHVPFDYDPRFILDAGAHIGCAGVYFAMRYPHARVLCVEASAENYYLLEHNTDSLPNVDVLHAALWRDDSGVVITNPTDDPWTFQVTAGSGDELVPSVTVDMIADQFGQPDFVKLDIEGAEIEVFEESGWLDWVEVLIVELHDRLRPGCTEAFEMATGSHSFTEYRRTFNRILRRLPTSR